MSTDETVLFPTFKVLIYSCRGEIIKELSIMRKQIRAERSRDTKTEELNREDWFPTVNKGERDTTAKNFYIML